VLDLDRGARGIVDICPDVRVIPLEVAILDIEVAARGVLDSAA
jgi:hypothetical protein